MKKRNTIIIIISLSVSLMLLNFKDMANVSRKYDKCKIEGCTYHGVRHKNGSEYFVKGYCTKHYHKWYEQGDALIVIHSNGESRKKHELYPTYCNIKARCYNENHPDYKRYGARGITVCDRWLGVTGFSNFIFDVGVRPKGTTLDRINNDKGYSNENFRWATRHQQNSNKRENNKDVGVYFDKSKNMWVSQLNINKKVVYFKRFKNHDDAVIARKEAEIKYNIVL